MARTDDGDFGYRLVIDALIGALMDLAAEGEVGAEEIEKMAVPTYGRTRAEFTTPFADSGTIAGLALASIEIFLGEDHIYEDYERDGDAGALAAWAGFVRASTFRRWRNRLKAAGRGGRSNSTTFSRRGSPPRLAVAPGPNAIPLPNFFW